MGEYILFKSETAQWPISLKKKTKKKKSIKMKLGEVGRVVVYRTHPAGGILS
jgi:hypothetical protein